MSAPQGTGMELFLFRRKRVEKDAALPGAHLFFNEEKKRKGYTGTWRDFASGLQSGGRAQKPSMRRENMAYSELIKNFSRIREYMREFYVYGFKSRDEFTQKSARSYDDERRRLESWLGDYMRFRQKPDGKSVFLSIDSALPAITRCTWPGRRKASRTGILRCTSSSLTCFLPRKSP